MIRSLFCLSLSLGLIACSGLLSGMHLQDYFEAAFLIPLLGGLLGFAFVFPRRELGDTFRQLLGRPARGEAAPARSRLLLQSYWRHLWQLTLLFLLLQGAGTLHHLDQPNYLGSFLATLLLAAIYLVLIKAVIFLPAELALADRSED